MGEPDTFADVDFGLLERVAANDRGLVLEVLELFGGQAPSWSGQLVVSADPAAWRAAAHSLKGSALAIGALALAQACEAAEEGASQAPAERQVLGLRVQAALEHALGQIEVYKAAR